jgi:hypothetical protein
MQELEQVHVYRTRFHAEGNGQNRDENKTVRYSKYSNYSISKPVDSIEIAIVRYFWHSALLL